MYGMGVLGYYSGMNAPIGEGATLNQFLNNVINIDGHNFEEILDAFDKAKMTKGMPTAIIAKTIKGKGVSFMEDKAEWHGKAPNEEQYNIAIDELK